MSAVVMSGWRSRSRATADAVSGRDVRRRVRVGVRIRVSAAVSAWCPRRGRAERGHQRGPVQLGDAGAGQQAGRGHRGGRGHPSGVQFPQHPGAGTAGRPGPAGQGQRHRVAGGAQPVPLGTGPLEGGADWRASHSHARQVRTG